MKQGFLSKGKVHNYEVPIPKLEDGMILIKTAYSCISAGTEMSAIATSSKSILSRAIEQPKKVGKVIKSVKTEGVARTLDSIRDELNKLQSLGYSLSGTVIGTATDVMNFSVGDRVAAAGGGFAVHSEVVVVPKNLVVHIPNGVGDKDAATVALGAIAMHGVRRCQVQMGEFVAVYGAGFLGLLGLQFLRAAGVRTVAIDIDSNRLALALKFGAELVINPNTEDVLTKCENFTGGHGVDAVLFTAATESNEPLSLAFQISRIKGKVILLGVSGMLLNRKDLYSKEVDFLISTSYGPGRYDDSYEVDGIDYPYGYVRWTENRNMSAYLQMISSGAISLASFSSSVYEIDKISEAFEAIKDSQRRTDITYLSYPHACSGSGDHTQVSRLNYSSSASRTKSDSIINVGVIGAGQYANNFHLPNLQKLSNDFQVRAIVTRTALSGKHAAEKYGAKYYGTDPQTIIDDDDIDLVVICTRHSNHADLTLRALEAGKHVFVEKPLATSLQQLQQIQSFFETNSIVPRLTVGFNRRFSAHASKIKRVCEERINPLFINYRVMAGRVPANHWVHDHGGRIIGEGCHFIDFMLFLVNYPIEKISFEKLRPSNDTYSPSDNVSIILKFSDGSIGNLQYLTLGSKKTSKEYIEIHCDGQSLILDNFQHLHGFDSKVKSNSSKAVEKGQFQQLKRFHHTLLDQTADPILPLWQIFETTRATMNVAFENYEDE